MPNGAAWGRSPSRSQSQRASSPLSPARDPRRHHLLRPEEWLWLASVAPRRLPTVEDRLALLPLLASGRDVGEDAHRPARTSASPPEEEPSAQRRNSSG